MKTAVIVELTIMEVQNAIIEIARNALAKTQQKAPGGVMIVINEDGSAKVLFGSKELGTTPVVPQSTREFSHEADKPPVVPSGGVIQNAG